MEDTVTSGNQKVSGIQFKKKQRKETYPAPFACFFCTCLVFSIDSWRFISFLEALFFRASRKGAAEYSGLPPQIMNRQW